MSCNFKFDVGEIVVSKSHLARADTKSVFRLLDSLYRVVDRKFEEKNSFHDPYIIYILEKITLNESCENIRKFEDQLDKVDILDLLVIKSRLEALIQEHVKFNLEET